MIRPLALGAAACLAALPAVAEENSGLKRLTLRQDLLGWEAVGRVDLAQGRGHCTGTLIAPALVLTAAYCVSAGSELHDPSAIRFRAGLRDAESTAEREAARLVLNPAYDPEGGMQPENIRHDVALLELASGIPAGAASPLRTDRPARTGARVTVVSHAAGRSDALSRQRVCAVLGTA